MLTLLRSLTRLIEVLIAGPLGLVRALTIGLAFNPKLGPVRYVVSAVLIYVLAAALLVYVVAPIRGLVGSNYQSAKLRYDAERWIATALYDSDSNFVGTFDPRLDSQRDVNFTGRPIEVGSYTANPDHKSIPVKEVPEYYWRCLTYHEDRNLGGWLNPFGIDFLGVLKIPFSSVTRSFREKRIAFGVGGSTLPMQLARVIYKTPPLASENPWEKIGRKLTEWWTAPVIYFELTRGGDDTPLKQWAANHLWLAQRTGGAPLHGIEVTSRIVFGKEAKALSPAEQFVLASAVNKPIILLEGSERLNAVRQSRWRYLLEVRARRCAEVLIEDPQTQKNVLFELVRLAGGPPDPQVRPALQAAVEAHAPQFTARARANPRIRANVLLPSARLGVREEMKQAFGFDWRNAVRGITTTLNPNDNLRLRGEVLGELTNLHKRWKGRLSPGFALDPDVARQEGSRMPDVIVVASDGDGRIVRYFENTELAPYFGSSSARDQQTGRYVRQRESRQIASVGKMIAAVAIGNEVTDTTETSYLDDQAPDRGLETCRRNGNLRRGRSALVSFACSLNRPLEWRTARVQPARIARLIDQFGFNMPPAPDPAGATPPSTAAVRGLISGSPRQVHHMASVILAALTGEGDRPVPPPTLVQKFEFTNTRTEEEFAERQRDDIVPAKLIRRPAHAAVSAFLQAPLCYEANRRSHGTLSALKDWCAARRKGLRLHFAKTGTAVTADPDATIDTWVAGGLQFANGAKYSYVIAVGTGSAAEPFARRLHSSQLAAPLLRVLLADLEQDARRNPPAVAAARRSKPIVATAKPKRRFSIRDLIERNFFTGN